MQFGRIYAAVRAALLGHARPGRTRDFEQQGMALKSYQCVVWRSLETPGRLLEMAYQVVPFSALPPGSVAGPAVRTKYVTWYSTDSYKPFKPSVKDWRTISDLKVFRDVFESGLPETDLAPSLEATLLGLPKLLTSIEISSASRSIRLLLEEPLKEGNTFCPSIISTLYDLGCRVPADILNVAPPRFAAMPGVGKRRVDGLTSYKDVVAAFDRTKCPSFEIGDPAKAAERVRGKIADGALPRISINLKPGVRFYVATLRRSRRVRAIDVDQVEAADGVGFSVGANDLQFLGRASLATDYITHVIHADRGVPVRYPEQLFAYLRGERRKTGLWDKDEQMARRVVVGTDAPPAIGSKLPNRFGLIGAVVKLGSAWVEKDTGHQVQYAYLTLPGD